MTKTFTVYHIICEGNSEVAYLKVLNKYLREMGCRLFLHPYSLGGVSSCSGILKKYREVKKNKKQNDEIFIWLDHDVFQRKQLSEDELRRKLVGFSGIKYNYQNFEDFLVMHLSDNQVCVWHEICRREKHFDHPMTGEDVEVAIQKIFSGYSKGCLPEEIQINIDSLGRLSVNQIKRSINFKSDFVDVIEHLLTMFK